jgi:hypothetical protein
MSLEVPRGRPLAGTPSTDVAVKSVTQPGRRLHLDLDQFRARVLQDALTEATAQYWIHRAHQFEDAAPRVGEFHGKATPDELRQRWYACMATATACRRHADLIRSNYPETVSEEVRDVLGEVARHGRQDRC